MLCTQQVPDKSSDGFYLAGSAWRRKGWGVARVIMNEIL
jgi:hypothetical protein